MKKEKKSYQFINAQTDNVIGYFSAPDGERKVRFLNGWRKRGMKSQ